MRVVKPVSGIWLVAACVAGMASAWAVPAKAPAKAPAKEAAAPPSSEPIPASFKAAGDFRVGVFLTNDAAGFQEASKKSLKEMAQKTSNRIKPGETLYAALMFGGCKPTVTQTCTVSAVFRIIPPKGKTVQSGRVYIWRGAAPAPQSIQLGEQPFAIALDKADPVGLYRVEVDVEDHAAGAKVTLRSDFLAER